MNTENELVTFESKVLTIMFSETIEFEKYVIWEKYGCRNFRVYDVDKNNGYF